MTLYLVIGAALVAVLLLVTRSGASAGASSTQFLTVESALVAGRKIDAIKLYRAQYGVGLKEAKEAVEAIQRTLPGNR